MPETAFLAVGLNHLIGDRKLLATELFVDTFLNSPNAPNVDLGIH
ncbi:MAG: hypothetical protein ABL923_04255 [Burkholderiaceae bacterium]